MFECHAWFTLGAVPVFTAAAILSRRVGRHAARLTGGQVALLLSILAGATAVTTILNSIFGCEVTFNPQKWREPNWPWSWF